MKNAKQLVDTTRRYLLRNGIAMGAALSAGSAAGATLPPSRKPGRTFAETGGYGSRSLHDDAMRVKQTDGTNLYGGGYTPLDRGFGMITPSGLHYEVFHNGCPEIHPDDHELLIHGLVKSNKIFTMSDLMRLPSVTRFHFLECAGNGWNDFDKPNSPNVQMSHGLTSCSEWTGVPLSIVLKELGVKNSAKWILAEGGDGAGLMRSIPIEKALDDALLVYAQNGELIRPEQGYPLRLLVPGFEGNMNVKWLRRLELGDHAWWTRSEVSEYADPMFDNKTQVFSFEMLAKSVITTPSAGMQLNATGFHEISGLAWSGLGKVVRVEVSTDGGGTWSEAQIHGPILPKCHTRFRLPWTWTGVETVLQSRVTDDTGYVQPTLESLRKHQPTGVNHNNAIQSWKISQDGVVSNVHHV
ncbi:MAG: sulfite dehydrogenase [Pseudomonadota bacterium]